MGSFAVRFIQEYRVSMLHFAAMAYHLETISKKINATGSRLALPPVVKQPWLKRLSPKQPTMVLRRAPFASFSNQWVKAAALSALVGGFFDCAEQCAGCIANIRIYPGKTVAPAPPSRRRIALNSHTAKISPTFLDENLLREAACAHGN